MQKTDRFLLVILALSLAANLTFFNLWQRDRKNLQNALADHSSSQGLPKLGARLDSLQLTNGNGEPLHFQFGPAELPTVAYVLSPSCKWCKLNQSNVNLLATRLHGKYHFIGLSVVPRADWDHDMQRDYQFPIYFVSLSSPHPDISLNVTPQTLVFSRDGRFANGWSGVYTGQTDRLVSSFFGVGPAK